MNNSRAIELSPMCVADFDRTFTWLQDACLRSAVDCLAPPLSQEENRHYWLARLARCDEVNFALRLEGEHVGNAGIRDIDWRRGCGEVYLYLDPERLGQGKGMAAGILLLQSGFVTLGLRRLSARVLATNSRAQAFWRRLGFSHEGCARASTLDAKGNPVDVMLLGLLAHEMKFDSTEGRSP